MKRFNDLSLNDQETLITCLRARYHFFLAPIVVALIHVNPLIGLRLDEYVIVDDHELERVVNRAAMRPTCR